jgi:hypothetical protein
LTIARPPVLASTLQGTASSHARVGLRSHALRDVELERREPSSSA